MRPEESLDNPVTRRMRFNTAIELFEALPQVREDMRAEPDARPSIDYLHHLQAGPTPEEAVTFASYLLPTREAVWWAHQCLHCVPAALTDQDHELLSHVENWVRDPDEPMRRAALDAAMAAEVKTPGVWAAFAAGWSGGSMAPPEAGPLPPPPFLTPRTVNAAVLSLLARVETRHREEALKAFVDMAVQLTES